MTRTDNGTGHAVECLNVLAGLVLVLAIYTRWLLGWRYIYSLHSADKPQEGRNSCPLLRSYFIGSCHVGVSKRFSRSISLAVYGLSSYIFLADQISCRSYVGNVYRMRSLAVSGFWIRAHEVTCFLKLAADQILVFSWIAGSSQVTLL